MLAKKPPQSNKKFYKYFQTARTLKHRNAKLKRNCIRISTLHFKILGKKTNLYSRPMLDRGSSNPAEIHCKKFTVRLRDIGVRVD